MRIKVEKLFLNVLESGAGEPALLFLHYWGGSARTWNGVIEQLCSDLAGDAAAVVRALDLKRYVLVGHSIGGKAAEFLVAQRPIGWKL